MAARKDYLFLHQKKTRFRSNKVNNACQYSLKQWQAPDATLRLFGAEVLRHLLLKYITTPKNPLVKLLGAFKKDRSLLHRRFYGACHCDINQCQATAARSRSPRTKVA